MGSDSNTVIVAVGSGKKTKMATKRTVRRRKETDLSLKGLFNDYQARNRYKNLTDATIETYDQTFEHFIEYVGEDTVSQDITEKTIIEFVAKIRERDLRPASVNHYLRGLRAFFYWCMDEGHMERFKIRMLREQEPIKATYDEDELLVLLREPKKNASFAEWRTWAAIQWMLDNGNRAKTVCSVRMADVSLERQEVRLTHTKSRKAQILPLGEDLTAALRKYIRMFRDDAEDEAFLFPSVTGEQLSVNALKLSVRSYNHNRGVEKSGVHMFRHTFAKMMIKNDCNAFRLQKMLGHSTLEMTRRYVNLYGQDLKENHEKYSPLHKMKQGKGQKHTIKRKK